MDGAPWDYGMDLIPEDVERIGEELAIGFARYPKLENVGIRRWVNGAFTFAPDGNPLVGPTRPGFWISLALRSIGSLARGPTLGWITCLPAAFQRSARSNWRQCWAKMGG